MQNSRKMVKKVTEERIMEQMEEVEGEKKQNYLDIIEEMLQNDEQEYNRVSNVENTDHNQQDEERYEELRQKR